MHIALTCLNLLIVICWKARAMPSRATSSEAKRFTRELRNPIRSSFWGHWACQVCIVILAMSLVAGAEQTGGADQLKAAYLYNFAKMMQWSAQRLPDSSNLIIGVFGGDENFVTALHDTLAGKAINGHPLEIRRLRSADELKFCHLVFFRTSERNTRGAIEQLGKTSVLLIGEDKNFLSEGGMINLVLSDGKITYEVNSAALERAGVHYGDMSSAYTKMGDELADVEPESSRPIIFRTIPEYPRIAVSLKITGAVQLQAIVRADGTVKQVRVMGGHPVLSEAAARSVMQWRYEPESKETTELVKVSFGQ